MSPPRILVSGATGFIGRAVCAMAHQKGHDVRGALRQPKPPQDGIDYINIGEISGSTDWRGALQDIEVVIHLAARAHIMNEASKDPLTEFRKTNVDGTLNLAEQAAAANIRRFIFVSSIGVNGNQTFQQPFNAESPPNPLSPYAISKYEAEQGLFEIAARTGIEVVILRPPLVYGPNAPGNFHRLVHALAKDMPLPLGAIHNKRSLVALDNLVDLVMVCLHHPAAANQIFLVSDDEDISTTELLIRTGRALGRPARLLPVPAGLLEWVAGLLGKADIARRLCGNLQVDIAKTRARLGWRPPLSLDEGLRRTAAAYRQERMNMSGSPTGSSK